MWLLVSFKNCLRQYRQTQSIAPQTHRWVGQLKLNPEQLVVLAQLIETNNDATLEELCDLLHQKIGITISFGHHGKNDTKIEYDFKKKTLFPSAKGSDRVQNLRYEFWQQLRKLNVKNLIFFDKSGVNLAMVRLYARSLKGSISLVS